MQSLWMPGFSEGDGQTASSLGRISVTFRILRKGWHLCQPVCFTHKEAGAPSHSLGVVAKLTLRWPRSFCSPLSWGPGLCAHNLRLSCWVTHWVRRVWALKNKRWRHFKIGEVKAVNIFEYLLAINWPLFSLAKGGVESLVWKRVVEEV